MQELTVSDVFTLHYILGGLINEDTLKESFYGLFKKNSLLQSVTDCPYEILLDLGVSELNSFYEIFLELNSQLFSSKQNKDNVSINFIDSLFSLCCDLVEVGHTDVLTYGYSFFLKAINNHEKIKGRKLVETAEAIRTASHADAKQWKRYVRSLVG